MTNLAASDRGMPWLGKSIPDSTGHVARTFAVGGIILDQFIYLYTTLCQYMYMHAICSMVELFFLYTNL